jgi:hypothetical protein
MGAELETAAVASVGGWLRWRRKHADIAPGTPCANCATTLAGAYCHGCGQLAQDFHKSIWKLVKEALESFFHLDGRLAQTLPRLIARPGRLTRDYLDGKRAAQVPPLRLFLVILLVTFVVGQCSLGGDSAVNVVPQAGEAAPAPQASLGGARAEIMADTSLSESERRLALATLDRNWGGLAAGLAAAQEANRTIQAQAPSQADRQSAAAFEAWLGERLQAVQAEPRRFALLLGTWAQRVALLMLPISALILSLLFFWRREIFVFDHLIFSMHSLSFQLLLTTATMILVRAVGPVAWFMLILSPIHLYGHMTRAYGSGPVMTLVRMYILFTATAVAVGLLLVLWLFLAFNEMSGA